MSTKELLPLTLKATAEVRRHRFVTVSGAHTGAGAQCFGVSRMKAAVGEFFTVDTYGISLVEAGAAVTQYSNVESDGAGRAINRISGSICGIAMESASGAGKLIPVFVYPGTLIGVPQPQIQLTAGTGGVIEGRAVTAAGVLAGAGGAGNPGQKIVGFATFSTGAGNTVTVQSGGEITASLAASQTVAVGDSLKTTDDGRLVKCAFSASTDWAVAIALEAVVTTSNPADIKVLITPTAAATVTA